MNNPDNKGRIIAAVGTLLVAALVVLLLVYSHIDAVRLDLAKAEEPQQDEEEIFIDAELEEEVFEEPPMPEEAPLLESQASNNLNDQPQQQPQQQETEAAPQAPKGQPDKAPVENKELKVADPKLPKQPVTQPKQVTQTQTSEVKVNNTSNSDTESKNISSKMGSNFNNGANGQPKGKEGGTGTSASNGNSNNSTGASSSVTGGPQGRTLLNRPSFVPKLNKPVTIRIKVTVNAAGNVVDASFVGDSGEGKGNQTLRDQCVAAAKKLRWNKLEGAPDVSGILTFKLTPK